MADFSSALYLGMRHPGPALPGWDSLTLGKPAALAEPPGAAALCRRLAALQGCEAATLLPSTLHLFWDLFAVLAAEPLDLLIDAGAYPIARWGAGRAGDRGVPLQVFARGDAGAAAALARRSAAAGRRPLILADGYVPGTAAPPPLRAYAGIAGDAGGYLVIDDTQVLGLRGRDGGGSLPWHGLAGSPHVLVGASLAKGFGAPLAVLAASAAQIARFTARSELRVHASPPSAAVIAAAARALDLNQVCGDPLRRRLAARVSRFRRRMAALGLQCRGGDFPVQSLCFGDDGDVAGLQARLARDGVAALLQPTGGRRGRELALTFLLRADHTAADIDRAAALVQHHLREVV